VLGEHALLRSTDAGEHFVGVARPPLQSEGTVPTLTFANVRDGFAFMWGSGPLYVTHDGGQSWHRAGPAGHVVSFALGGREAYVVAGRVLERSPVGRNAWRKLPVRVSRLPVSLAARGSNVWLLDPPRHRPDFDTIVVSSDRGRTWALQKGPCLSELGGTLEPAPDGVVWAVCPTGNMAELTLSKNDGRSFPSISSVHDPGGVRQPRLVNSARIAAASAHIAVLSRGAQGALLRTTDAGRHWTRVARTARIQDVSWLAFTTRRVGAAVVQTGPRTEQLWRTTDAGATWHFTPIR
jgi:photosystem II stability/assembly factor-like uncharacterized protein